MTEYEKLLGNMEPKVRRAFASAINEITSKAQLGKVIEALKSGNVTAALEAIYIDRAAFSELERLLQEAYADGGKAAIDDLGVLRDVEGSRFVFRFDERNFAAEQWIRNVAGARITEIVTEQLQETRLALEDGVRRGANPRTTALNIIGRLNRQTGNREGGTIGLHSKYIAAANKAREELENGEYRKFLARKLRDKRFDSIIRKASEKGEDLTKSQTDRLLTLYKGRLLKARGEAISRTETLAALSSSSDQAMQQLIADGKVTSSQITKTWDSVGGSRVRFSHATMDGTTVSYNDSFITPRGRSMRHPHDPSGGAEEIVNCRCRAVYRINYLRRNS